MSAADLTWVEVDAKAPRWQRRAAMGADGTVFVTAAIAGSEMAVLLCAGYDGTAVLVADGHLYVPAPWVAREFPKAAGLALKIERRTREHLVAAP